MINKKFFPLIVLLSLLIGLVGACGSDEPTPTPFAELKPDPTATIAPAPTATTVETKATTGTTTNVSPLSAPVSPLAAPAPTIDARTVTSPTTGAIAGILIVKRSQEEIRVSNAIIGLAEVVKDVNGRSVAAGYNQATPYRTTTDADGRFVIANVPPGDYALILDTVVASSALKNPATPQYNVVIKSEAGKVTDLGFMIYDSLPLPGFTK